MVGISRKPRSANSSLGTPAEETSHGFLPDCVACGDTLDEVRMLIREAVELHIESLRENSEPVPPPTSIVDRIHAA